MHAMKQYKPATTSNFFQTIWGFALVLMVVMGICGTLYKLLAPNGWVAALMGQGFSGGVAVVGLMIVFSVVGWISRNWTTTREQAGVATVVVYLFALAGALYAFQFWTKGTF